MSTKKKGAPAPSKLVHPLARRVSINAWLMLKAQDKYKNPHQLGVAAEHAGLAAKNTIRNIFYPEARPYGKHEQPTAPLLDSLDAAARALGVPVHDFLDPNLEQTLTMRREQAIAQRLLGALYADCPDLFLYTDQFAKDVNDKNGTPAAMLINAVRHAANNNTTPTPPPRRHEVPTP